MKAMILAAGLGTRLRPLTLSTPKPLIPVNGKPLIEYHIERLARAGFLDITINHAWLGQQIEEYLGGGEKWGVNIRYSAETEPLETAGGVYQVLDHLSPHGEPFLLINGDITTDFNFATLKTVSPTHGHLIMVPNPPHHPEGDFLLNGNRLSESEGSSYTFSGISVLTATLFEMCRPGKSPLGPLFRGAIAKDQLSGELTDSFWIDVGTPERLEQASHYYRGRQAHGN